MLQQSNQKLNEMENKSHIPTDFISSQLTVDLLYLEVAMRRLKQMVGLNVYADLNFDTWKPGGLDKTLK